MKIREIIELSKTDSLAKIAKEHLSVGKEKAREGLKLAGCYSKNGVKGWFFDGDKTVLEQSIYDFVSTTRKAKPSPNVSNKSNKSAKSLKSNISEKSANVEIIQAKEQVAPTIERRNFGSNVNFNTNVSTNIDRDTNTNLNTNVSTNIVRKRASFDLDVDLVKKLKVEAVIQDKNLYEMVEIAIREYLKGLK
ncbi:CopG family transcriptional regulator [Priestia megaterium]|uniref:hypothetical protein n=1 Tax=Priestia megaterium TaxID=1404 RepID=UPI002E200438|nr:hypothetical protein [Priestia megaterium]